VRRGQRVRGGGATGWRQAAGVARRGGTRRALGSKAATPGGRSLCLVLGTHHSSRQPRDWHHESRRRRRK
jgi:hypothetical protein